MHYSPKLVAIAAENGFIADDPIYTQIQRVVKLSRLGGRANRAKYDREAAKLARALGVSSSVVFAALR